MNSEQSPEFRGVPFAAPLQQPATSGDAELAAELRATSQAIDALRGSHLSIPVAGVLCRSLDRAAARLSAGQPQQGGDEPKALARWLCEQHPEKEWPHDDCGGPGMLVHPPHRHVYDALGFCSVCRMTRKETVMSGDLIAEIEAVIQNLDDQETDARCTKNIDAANLIADESLLWRRALAALRPAPLAPQPSGAGALHAPEAEDS